MNHLETNKPIIVCVWNKPTDNRWTTASHYMVLLATDGNNMVYVSNPNGLEMIVKVQDGTILMKLRHILQKLFI